MSDLINKQDAIDAIKTADTKDMVNRMDDLISRQAAIRIAEQGQIQGFEWQIKKLLGMPSAQPEQQWITCSERLPEVGQEVICCCRADITKVLKLDSDMDWYQDANHIYMNGFVVAWMPLPSPYKEVER